MAGVVNVAVSTSDEENERCSLLLATCDRDLSVVGYGDNCTFNTVQSSLTSTISTLKQLDIKLYSQLIYGIDERLRASRVKGVPPNVAKSIYSIQDYDNLVYVRNRDCWTYGLDLSPVSPWNSDLGERKPWTLVSPRHVIGLRHYNTKLNSTVRFVDSDNNAVERSLIKITSIAGPAIQAIITQDIAVGELDKDVPSTMTFAKVLPHNLSTFLIPYNSHIPTLSTDLDAKALVDDVYLYSTRSAGLLVPSPGSIRYDYHEPKTSGDSGSPSFLILNNDLVLWLVYSRATGGLVLSQYIQQINDIMSSHYKLTEDDLSDLVELSAHIVG